jgi:hypothetical protein
MLEFFGAVPALWVPDNLKVSMTNILDGDSAFGGQVS